MRLRITLEADVPEGTRDIRTLEATRQSISKWAAEELGTTQISFALVQPEEGVDEDFDRELDLARYGALGQG